MVFRPEIYISATPIELDAYREAVRQALREIGARVVELQDYGIEYGPLQGVLHQLIGRAEVFIHLTGSRYGLEPAERTLHAPRRSFGHYEVDVAQSLGKPIYFFVTSPQAKLPLVPGEPEELRLLQRDHRHAIQQGEHPVAAFSDPEELAQMIRELRGQIMVRRRLARLPREPMRERFIARRQLRDNIKNDLVQGGIHVLHPQPEAIDSGGAGRTALAMELAWELYEERRIPFVFALPGGPRVDVEMTLAALARSDALGLLPNEVVDHKARLEAVLRWFRDPQHAGKWMVILDAVDAQANWRGVRPLVSLLGHGAVLITSRLTAWPEMKGYAIRGISQELTRDFLIEKAGLPRGLARADSAALERMGEGVGRLPLGLELIAAHLRESGKSPSQFFAECIGGENGGFSNRTPGLPEILERSTADLDAYTRGIFHELVCLEPEPAWIPLGIFEHRGDWAQVRDAFALLERRALIHRDASGRSIAVHRTVREILLEKLRPGDFATALGAILGVIDMALRRTGDREGAATKEQLVPHCRSLLALLQGHPLELNATRIFQAVAHWLQDAGRPAEAETYFRKALAVDQKRLGPEHPEVAARLHDLSAVLRLRGKARDAEVISRRALAMAEKSAGHDHPDIVSDLYHVAGCLRAANRLAEAEPFYRRVLALEERNAGPSHPRTSIALHRLAGLLELNRRRGEAEAFYRRAVAIDQRAFAPGHPRVAICIHNLAGLLATLRRWEEAEALCLQALEADERTFGPDHHETAAALKLLATIYDESGREAEAEKVYRRILSIDEHAFGPDHTEVAADLLSLASILLALERPAEAEPLALRALKIFIQSKRSRRFEHPSLSTATRLYQTAMRGTDVPEEEITRRIQWLLPTPPRDKTCRLHARW